MASWKDFYKAELFTADRIGKVPLNMVIESVIPETITSKEKGDETRLQIKFVGEDRELRLNKTNVTTLSKAFGDDYEKWAGKRVKLSQCDTQFNGRPIKGVRVEAIKK